MSATSKRNRALEAGEEPVTGKEMMDNMNQPVVRELPEDVPVDANDLEENEDVE